MITVVPKIRNSHSKPTPSCEMLRNSNRIKEIPQKIAATKKTKIGTKKKYNAISAAQTSTGATLSVALTSVTFIARSLLRLCIRYRFSRFLNLY